MKPGWKFWTIVALIAATIGAAIYFPALRRRVRRTAQLQQQSDEQARRELTQTEAPPADAPVQKAKLYWASNADDDALAPSTVDLRLSDDPVLRAKQVINVLLAGPVDVELRTLPPDTALLAFYLMPDGTGVADFSEALATETPSGIQSEQMAVDSIAQTLQANVPQVKRLKILIHGQEVETLAGHLDLTGTFPVNSGGAAAVAAAAPAKTPSAAGGPAPANSVAAPAANKPTPAPLIPSSSPSKQAAPAQKP